MEYDSGEILHFEVGDSRQVDRKSNLLERMTVTKGLDYLRACGVRVTEVVTDASRSIISLLGKVKIILSQI